MKTGADDEPADQEEVASTSGDPHPPCWWPGHLTNELGLAPVLHPELG